MKLLSYVNMTMSHATLKHSPMSSVFPIDAATAELAANTFASFEWNELEFVQDINVRLRDNSDPIGYLLHLTARPELEDRSEGLRIAYRLGVCVVSTAVQIRLEKMRAAGVLLASPAEMTQHNDSPWLHHVSHAPSSRGLRVVGERHDLRPYVADSTSLTRLSRGLRTVWQERFSIFTEPETASYDSLGMQDAFNLYAYLYKQ